jgi:uncharacterized protein (TIGR01319 family)
METGMRHALLVDFGSTYTKVRAVDLSTCRLVGTAQGPSTVSTDITIGLNKALNKLERAMGGLPDFAYRLGSSSAAGGLRMVTIGLVPELTAEAARLAALGAGAKVVGTFSYGLVAEDQAKIESLEPDVVLLAGGTDGGNTKFILGNARFLAQSALNAPVIVAGNRQVTNEVCEILRKYNKTAIATKNVMPSFGAIDIEAAQAEIREVFLKQIVHTKGLDRASAMLDGVTMPTPVAVLNAARLLAEGVGGSKGLGDLVIIDPGGATTDVHSACRGLPTNPRIIRRGLPDPYLKRTVEGDLGLRHNADSILQAEGAEGLARVAGLSVERVAQLVAALEADVESLPTSVDEAAIDFALGRAAINIAVERHAGHIQVVYGNEGPVTFQYGKDLSKVATIIGTGGILAHGRTPELTLAAALRGAEETMSLRPRTASLFLDKDYLLFACGLLAEVEPEAAFRLATSGIVRLQASGQPHALTNDTSGIASSTCAQIREPIS